MRWLVPLCVLAGPALAQDQVSLPAGCAAYVTMQSKDCSVTHYFTCEGDPAALNRRIDYDEQGPTYVGGVDDEAQWVESRHLLTGHEERLAPNPADAQSLTELFATGFDSWDFMTESLQVGLTRYVGSDRLTGETVVIDGVELERTAYEIIAYTGDGSEIWRAAGEEYVSREWRMFFGGTSTVGTADETIEEPDGSPAEFIFPGEPGFLSPNPKYGCGLVMSSWEPLP